MIESVLEELLQRVDVARHPGEQSTGALVGVEVDRQALQVREHPQPELVQQLLAESTRERHPPPAGDGRHDHRGDVQQGHEDDHAGVARGDPLVDASLRQHAAGLQGHGLEHDEDERDHEAPPVAAEEAAERERVPIGGDRLEPNGRRRVYRFGREDRLRPLTQLRRHAGEGQSRGSARLRSARPEAATARSEHHSPTTGVSSARVTWASTAA